jgi:peptidoglycan/LPS O-acetylase OafA/YrhL
LTVEVSFYAFLPLWAWFARRLPGRDAQARLRSEVMAVSALVAGSLVYTAVLVYSGAVEKIPFAPVAALAALPGYMDHLGIGMLLAVLSVWVAERPETRLPGPVALLARYPAAGWAIAAAGVIAGAAIVGTGFYSPTEFVLRHLLNGVVAFAPLTPAIFGDAREGLVRRILGNRAILYVGLISYSFYLYHWAVINELYKWRLDGTFTLSSYPAWLAASFAGALILGSLSYYLVERPALSLKRLVPWQRDSDRQEALAEPAPATPVTAPPS